MKLFSILSKVGTAVVKNVVPGGEMIIGAVNELLPDDKKLPTTASGDQISQALDTLPAAERLQLLERKFDVQETQIRQENETLREFLRAEAASPHTTRPQIARRAFWVVTAVTLAIVCAWLVSVIKGDTETVSAIMEGWPFVAALIGPFVVWLNQYFGILSRESRNRLNASIGQPSETGITGLLQAFKK